MSSREGSHFRLEAFYNWTGLLGLALVAVNLAASFVVLAADILVGVEYDAVLYALFGLGTLLGVVIFGLGGWLGRRHLRLGGHSRVLEPWTLDLTHARDRRFALVGLMAFVPLVGVFASATGQGIRYMESREFCVDACHTVMEPEGTAALDSPHSRLACADCHVGSGAIHFAQAKINGMRQLWGIATNSYPRPIPLPLVEMVSADRICERCHAREHWVGHNEKQYTYFAGDEQNTAHPLRMMIPVGGVRPDSGAGEGIHYHMLLDRTVEYVAADSQKREILWVRVTDGDGAVRIYRRGEEGTEQAIAGKTVHPMSCLDCHSRPAHRFRAPTDLMNELLASGHVDPALPSIKTAGVALLEQEYPDRQAALTAIDREMRGRYADANVGSAASLASSTAAIQGAWQRNSFPSMKVDWRTYPDHIGHRDSPGCFRCHNDELTTDTGEMIFTDCKGCHVVLTQGESFQEAPVDFDEGLAFFHFADEYAFEEYEDCASCHNGGSDIY
ncbi:MAG: NapC/NirT family cytochrome c [Myxococcota bacterium]